MRHTISTNGKFDAKAFILKERTEIKEGKRK
jgi:hypothetical protein